MVGVSSKHMRTDGTSSFAGQDAIVPWSSPGVGHLASSRFDEPVRVRHAIVCVEEAPPAAMLCGADEQPARHEKPACPLADVPAWLRFRQVKACKDSTD
jgi:hypothetical protein